MASEGHIKDMRKLLDDQANAEKKLMEGVLFQLDTEVDQGDRMVFKRTLELIAQAKGAFLTATPTTKFLASMCLLLMKETAQIRLKLGELENRRPPPFPMGGV